VIEPHPPDDLSDVAGEARQREAGVEPRRVPGHLPLFQDNDRPAAARQFVRDRQTGEAGPHDAGVDIEIAGERSPRRDRHHRFGIPAWRIGLPRG
jgi:hypothetical protein